MGFKTKPQLGRAMLERALAAGVPCRWVAGDTVYGGDRRLRIWLEEHAIRQVMAVRWTEPVWALTEHGPGQAAAQDLIAQVPAAQWLRINAGDGSKGKRLYDWTRVALWRWGWPANLGFWLLARRSLSGPGELAYYVCFGPANTPLVTLVQVADCRWRWRRPSSRPRVRSAWTTIRSADTRPGTGTSPWPWRSWPPPRSPARRHRRARGAVVVSALACWWRSVSPSCVGCWPAWSVAHHLIRCSPWAWSVWRRRHQATARRTHYQQRGKLPL